MKHMVKCRHILTMFSIALVFVLIGALLTSCGKTAINPITAEKYKEIVSSLELNGSIDEDNSGVMFLFIPSSSKSVLIDRHRKGEDGYILFLEFETEKDATEYYEQKVHYYDTSSASLSSKELAYQKITDSEDGSYCCKQYSYKVRPKSTRFTLIRNKNTVFYEEASLFLEGMSEEPDVNTGEIMQDYIKISEAINYPIVGKK